MKNIKLQNPVELKAKGELNSKHCKPVLCIETGTIYTSATDAANAMGVHPSAISLVCIGRVKTCKGNHFCYLSNLTESVSEIAVRLQEVESLYADANAYREQQAREKAARIEEEKRQEEERKEKEKLLEDISKARSQLARRVTICDRKGNEYTEAVAFKDEAALKLDNLLREYENRFGNANNPNEEEVWTA